MKIGRSATCRAICRSERKPSQENVFLRGYIFVLSGFRLSSYQSVFIEVLPAIIGTFAASFRAFQTMQIAVVAAFVGTAFACLYAYVQNFWCEVAGICQRRGGNFAYVGAFDSQFDTTSHHRYGLFFETCVETIFAGGLTLVYIIEYF